MKEKISYERRDYEAVVDASQSKTVWGKTSQILSPSVKGQCCYKLPHLTIFRPI